MGFPLSLHFDPLLIALAVVVCMITVAISIHIPSRFPSEDRRRAFSQRMIAGLVFGLGGWSSHFISALAYEDSAGSAYSPAIVLLSLGLALVIGCVLAQLLPRELRSDRPVRDAAICAIGLASLHYVAMAGAHAPAEIVQVDGYVAATLMVAIAFGALVIWALRSKRMVLCGTFFCCGILGLEFVSLGAIAAVDGHAVLVAEGGGVPSTRYAVLLAAATILVATYCGTAIFFARRAAFEMHERERQFGLLAQGIKDTAICLLDPDGKVMTWNAGACRLKGYTAEEAIGMNFAEFYAETDRELGAPQDALDTARKSGSFLTHGWRRRKDGTRFWADVLIEPFHDDRGAMMGYAKITRDISERKMRDEQLREMARSLDAALSNMHQGLALLDQEEKLVLANDRCEQVLGLRSGSLVPGMSFRECARLVLEARHGEAIEEEALDEAVRQYRAMFNRPGGGTITEEYSENSVLTITHRMMDGGGWVLTVEDVTDRHRVEKRIHHMAMHDALTGLPNREAFRRALTEKLERLPDHGERIGVAIIDLDDFKDVNDSYGHAAGDAFLLEVASRMLNSLLDGEFLARLGGDEFAAFKVIRRDTDADDFLRRLARNFGINIRCGEYQLPCSGSIGFALGPRDGATCEELCGMADLAMYRAKRSASEKVCRYEPGMDDEARARKHLARELGRAVDCDQLTIAYQAQWSVRDEAIVGYEALLRWNHPELGQVLPMRFIEIAEENGEIVRIGEWVLQRACEEAMGWEGPCRVSVNISPVQLVQNGLAKAVMRALIVSGLPPERLELEITESALITDKLRALHNLRQIKALGVTIAIDDFGTGYSSLDTLNSFPFDKIKIDGSFLADLEKSHQARSIIRSVLALGRSLEIPVLAEGVETREQLEFLRRERCDEVQGFLFGHPMRHGDRNEQPAPRGVVEITSGDSANWII